MCHHTTCYGPRSPVVAPDLWRTVVLSTVVYPLSPIRGPCPLRPDGVGVHLVHPRHQRVCGRDHPPLPERPRTSPLPNPVHVGAVLSPVTNQSFRGVPFLSVVQVGGAGRRSQDVPSGRWSCDTPLPVGSREPQTVIFVEVSCRHRRGPLTCRSRTSRLTDPSRRVGPSRDTCRVGGGAERGRRHSQGSRFSPDGSPLVPDLGCRRHPSSTGVKDPRHLGDRFPLPQSKGRALGQRQSVRAGSDTEVLV